jgi:spoIIIJ-associated protein
MDEKLKSTITELITTIVRPLAGESEITFEKEGEQWRVNIKVKKKQLLIGYKDEVLSAIQHYVRVAAHKKNPQDRTHFILDIDGYKHQKEKILNEVIPGIAETEVLKNGKTVVLVGLNGYERLVIHKLLADVKSLDTTSVGNEPNRKMVIRPTSETGSVGIEDSKIIDINSLID